jgi:hypothetical protein
MRRFWICALVAATACLPEASLELPDAGARRYVPPVSGPDAGPAHAVDAGAEGSVDSGPLLAVDRVDPRRGPAAGGTRVQVRGRGFLGGSEVLLGGIPVRDLMIANERVMTFYSPAAPVGSGDLLVRNALGQTLVPGAFTWFVDLEVDGISPAQGEVTGGVQIAITGAGFTDDTVFLVDGRPLRGVSVDEGRRAVQGWLPPGSRLGAVTLQAVNPFGEVVMPDAFTYLPSLRVAAVSPAAAVVQEAVDLVVHGEGLRAAMRVRLGGVDCAQVTLQSSHQATCHLPASAESGAVDLSVSDPYGAGVVEGAFLWLAQSTELNVAGVVPTFGPPAGNHEVTLYGAGFDAANLSVTFGGEVAEVLQVNSRSLRVLVPPGPVGAVTVQVSTAQGTAQRVDGYRYRHALDLLSVDPGSGPASGGTELTVSGVGFCPRPHVFLGGMEQQVVRSAIDELVVVTAAAPGGEATLRVVCGEQEALLEPGFRFVSPLSVFGLHPIRGAQAGGTLVTVTGAGFDSTGLRVFLGAQEVHDLEPLGDAMLRFRTPAGEPGAVDLALVVDGDDWLGDEAFTYYDPGFRYGGTRGGEVAGSVNVTVLNLSANLAPIEGAAVFVGLAGDRNLSGRTDLRGQVTLSQANLRGPQTVTATKEGCSRTTTLVEVAAADLTFWLSCPVPPSEGNGGGGTPPAGGPPIISGKITGFSKALFDPETLGPDEVAFAQVRLTRPSVDAGEVPVWGRDMVWQEGGTFSFAVPPGRYALVALAGVMNSRTQSVLRTSQLGMRRGINAVTGERVRNADIALSYPMDRAVSVRFDRRLVRAEDQPNQTLVSAHLDFGGEGVFPLAREVSRWNYVVLNNLPRVPGELIAFEGGLVTDNGSAPFTVSRARGNDDLDGGVTLGPLLPIPRWLSPERRGFELRNRLLHWKASFAGARPNYQRLQLSDAFGGSWTFFVPGTQTKLAVPRIPRGVNGLGAPGGYAVDYSAIQDPRFDIDNFSFLETWYSNWRAWARTGTRFELTD